MENVFVNPGKDMKRLSDMMIKLKMKTVALENKYVNSANDFNFLRIAIVLLNV